MYRKHKFAQTTLKVNEQLEGERLEQKIMRIVNNNEPITDGAPLVYTERKEGVLAETDIRTDRWEIAVEAMDKIDKSNKAKREQFQKELAEKNKTPEQKAAEAKANENKGKEAGGQSAQGTDTK